jgi:hypothetical protein
MMGPRGIGKVQSPNPFPYELPADDDRIAITDVHSWIAYAASGTGR